MVDDEFSRGLYERIAANYIRLEALYLDNLRSGFHEELLSLSRKFVRIGEETLDSEEYEKYLDRLVDKLFYLEWDRVKKTLDMTSILDALNDDGRDLMLSFQMSAVPDAEYDILRKAGLLRGRKDSYQSKLFMKMIEDQARYLAHKAWERYWASELLIDAGLTLEDAANTLRRRKNKSKKDEIKLFSTL